MADLATSIFTSLEALYTADTGAGGLNESSDTSQARVRHFVRMGDPNFDADRTFNWPIVRVEVFAGEMRSFSNRHADCVIRMHVYTLRDHGFADQSAVNARIVSVYDGARLATQSPFNFSVMTYQRHFQAASSGTDLHYVQEFSVRPMA